MKKYAISLLFCFPLLMVNAQDNSYQYRMDLTAIENDQLSVELITPEISEKTAVFYMPKIVPGTYRIYDFGRFVSGFQAFDEKGRPLKVQRLHTNGWQIKNARRLHRISYQVDDSDDYGSDNPVSGMSGTNIEAGENFLINTHGFFGYFEGMKELPFELTIRHPEGFYGSTSLIATDDEPLLDTYIVPDYMQLVDAPLMYSRPDTAMVQVADTEVLISVHDPAGNITAEAIREEVSGLLYATEEYLGGELPVEKYAFLFYFRDPQAIRVGSGALEHSYSSLYYLPSYPAQMLMPFLVDVCAHEFFHILTPLNIHSEEIHFFDYNDPDMSKHLWLYEGCTEYFAQHMQVYEGLSSPESFLQRVEQKLNNSQSRFDDSLAFTRLSEGSLDEFKEEYVNVYEKGALIGMSLDIKLRQYSDGKLGLRGLIQRLSERYGKDKPFEDDELFATIGELSFPEIRTFLETYVAADNPLPYAALFEQVGVAYSPRHQEADFTLGGVKLSFNSDTRRLVVADVSEMNEFGRAMGYQVGDEIVALDGQEIGMGNAVDFIKEYLAQLKEGELVSVEAMRPDEAGGYEKVVLSAPAQKASVSRPAKLRFSEDASEEQLALRRAWLGSEGEEADR